MKKGLLAQRKRWAMKGPGVRRKNRERQVEESARMSTRLSALIT